MNHSYLVLVIEISNLVIICNLVLETWNLKEIIIELDKEKILV